METNQKAAKAYGEALEAMLSLRDAYEGAQSSYRKAFDDLSSLGR